MSVETATHRQRPPPLLAERYVIVRRLGKGGAANVYLAFDLVGKLWRAMKVMHPNLAGDRDLRTRFFREARLMASIDHPHVVRVSDVGEGDVPFMVMEFVRGGCLIDWLRHHGAMPAPLAARVARDIALGLSATHAKTVVHRDVKPHNVLVNVDGSCKLTDYGIAKLSSQSIDLDDGEEAALTRVGTSMGTVAFMPPEQQHNAAAVDARADLYALGATLFTLLKCKAPQDLYVADASDEQLQGIPAELVEIILTCCRYQPEDRYESASALHDALSAAIDALGPVLDETPDLIRLNGDLPTAPPAAVEREHVEELLELVATGHAQPYEPTEGGTLSSEGGGVHLTVDDYTLTPLAAERPSEPPRPVSSTPEAPPTPDTLSPVSNEGAPPFPVVWLAGALVVALVLVTIGGFGLIAATQAAAMSDASSRRDASARELIDALESVDPLIDAVAAKGDQQRIDAAASDFEQAGTDLEKLASGLALVDLVEKQHGAIVTRFGAQPALDGQVEALGRIAGDVERAQDELQAAEASVGGALALKLGLAKPVASFGAP